MDDYTVLRVNHPGPDLSVAGRREIAEGRRHDFVPEHPLPKMLPDPVPMAPEDLQSALRPPKLPPVWHYHRVGHDRPHVLEARGGRFLLEGNPLQDDEVATILDNVRARTARLRYVKGAAHQAVTKMERAFADLKKADDEMDVQKAMAHLDTLKEGDEKTSAAVAFLRKFLFEDPMNPGVGNKYAYEQFRKKGAPGVYVSLDLNNFKQLNDAHGHDAGDAAIRAFGAAARAAADPARTKLFRAGGDEYVLHAPDAATAHGALRALRAKVDAVTPIGGTHKLSFSAGLGPDFATADRALYQAKQAKLAHLTATKGAPGALPHFTHSLLPGAEGPVPLDAHEQHPHPPELPVASAAEAPSKAA